MFCSDYLHKWIKYIPISLAIFLPCFVAAVRDMTIGTDVQVYGIYVYTHSKNQSFLSSLSSVDSTIPPGFIFIAWCVNMLGGSIEWYFFVIELLVILPVYLSLKFFCEKYTWLGMFIFYCLCYSASLNIMKQMIAVSLSVLAFRFCIERKNGKFIFTALLATSVHQTGIITFLIFPLMILSKKIIGKNLLTKIVFYIVIFTVLAAIFMFSSSIIDFLSSQRDSYSYMQRNVGMGGVVLPPLIYLAFIIIIRIVFVSSLHKINFDRINDSILKDNTFFLFEFLSIFGLLFMETQVITLGLSRFGYYFEVYLAFYVGYLYKKQNTILVRALLVILTLCIAALSIRSIVIGDGEVYPYTSVILGIE